MSIFTFKCSIWNFSFAQKKKDLFCLNCLNRNIAPSKVYTMPQSFINFRCVRNFIPPFSHDSDLPKDAVNTQCTTENPLKDLPTVEV